MTLPAPRRADDDRRGWPARRPSSCASTRRSTGWARRRSRSSSRGSRSSYFAKDATDPRRAARAGRAPAHRPARAGRQPSQQHAGRSRPHAGPGRAVPGRRAVGGRHDDQDLRRAAGHVLLPARARRLPRAAAGVARVRALLHAGDHRDAEAVAGEPVQPVQRSARPSSRRSRARSPSWCAIAPVTCPATATLREAARDDGRRPRCARSSRWRADGAPVGMFTLVDLLRRVVLPGRAAGRRRWPR